jgi:hypothetical protein
MKHLLLLALVALLSCNDNKSGDPDNDEDSTSNENIAPQQRIVPADSVRYIDHNGDTITKYRDGSTMKDTLR